MAGDHVSLEQQLQILHEENQALRAELDHIKRREEMVKQARVRLLRGGFRILIPLLDRQRVARSFGKLVTTVSGFAGPSSRWPAKEEILADAREFMESCVRFVIRRRMILLFFSLLASAVPAIQIWLVVQQNEIIKNQNEFFEIQVYDILARSMTESDRNARQITGALLGNTKIEFLSGVVKETFDPSQQGIYRAEGVHAAKRRLEDAAFRGHLMHAVSRGVEQHAQRGDMGTGALYEVAQPMFRQILRDTTDRLPTVLRIGREATELDGELAEQVDNYIIQLGELLSVYSRLARSAGKKKVFFSDITPLLERLTGTRSLTESRFAPAYRTAMEGFLFDLAVAPKLGAPPVDLEAKGLTPENALRQGLERLRQGVGDKTLNWTVLEQQVISQ